MTPIHFQTINWTQIPKTEHLGETGNAFWQTLQFIKWTYLDLHLRVEHLPGYLIWIFLVIGVSYFFIKQQNKSVKWTLNKYNLELTDGLKVKYSMTESGPLRYKIGIPINASMFVKNNLLIITTNLNSLVGSLLVTNLPSVFNIDKNQNNDEVTDRNVIAPDVFSISDDITIKIDYRHKFHNKLRYKVKIRIVDNEKFFDLVELEKNWL